MVDPAESRETPTLPEPKAWAFHYTGPIEPKDDRTCPLCNAAAARQCTKDFTAHGKTPEACSTCHAARMALCHHHCGIARALEEHLGAMGHVIHAEQLAGWLAAKTYVLAQSAAWPPEVREIQVRVHANQDQPEMPFAAVFVELVARK